MFVIRRVFLRARPRGAARFFFFRVRTSLPDASARETLRSYEQKLAVPRAVARAYGPRVFLVRFRANEGDARTPRGADSRFQARFRVRFRANFESEVRVSVSTFNRTSWWSC